MATKNLPALADVQQSFMDVCKDAKSLRIANNFGAAFTAVTIVSKLREILTDDIMNAVFMPLMNTKIGFLTDRTGKADRHGNIKPTYTIDIVRDCVIDAISYGLMPTGNQFNILAEKMYPTKEGYTHLLREIKVKYILDVSYDNGQNKDFAVIPVKINYEYDGKRNAFTVTATVKKDSFSSHDALRGKAERRAKKALYEYITGLDLGDGDEDSTVVDISHTDVTDAQRQRLNVKNEDEARKFFVTDLAYTEESVKGKGLFEMAKKEGLEIVIVTGEPKIDKANQKKQELKNKANSGRSSQATLL